jgi:phosphoribosylanthranilate isomerase
MSLKTKVKAGNITNLSDARYCAGMGVDWLSFPAQEVNPVSYKEITDWVIGPEFILEVNEAIPLQTIQQYPVNTLEISHRQLSLIDLLISSSWIVTIPLSSWDIIKDELLKYKSKIRFLVITLDGPDINKVQDIASHFKLLINQSDNYPMVELLLLPIEGINVNGESELKPGLKDFDKLSSILEELEVID